MNNTTKILVVLFIIVIVAFVYYQSSIDPVLTSSTTSTTEEHGGVGSTLASFTSLIGMVVALRQAGIANAKSIEVEEQRKAAEKSEANAMEHLAEFRRMADVRRLQDLVSQDAELWPAIPSKVAAIRDWIKRAKNLLARLPLHEAKLADLRKSALPYSDEQAARDRKGFPKAARLAEAELFLRAAQRKLKSLRKKI